MPTSTGNQPDLTLSDRVVAGPFAGRVAAVGPFAGRVCAVCAVDPSAGRVVAAGSGLCNRSTQQLLYVKADSYVRTQYYVVVGHLAHADPPKSCLVIIRLPWMVLRVWKSAGTKYVSLLRRSVL